ncbi:MAG: calcium:proton antiporter [Hyphomicrobium sp.]
MVHTPNTPVWTWLFPVAGLVFFAAASVFGFDEGFENSALGIAIAVALVPLLLAAVFAAVYHAEEAAHLTGEPVGTLILTIAVTVIELALIVSLMLAGKAGPTVVRDTVFAVIMIITTGLVGLCITVGGLRYREQTFDVTSAKIYLAMLIVLASLTLIMPNYTMSAEGPVYSGSQIAFVSIMAIMLYLVFLYTQTVMYKDYFVSSAIAGTTGSTPKARLVKSILFLIVALTAVVLLAKLFAPVISFGVAAAGAPIGVVGVVIALVVLTPESIAAVRAATDDNLQKSLNLALGSTLATIGLTIPAMAAVNAFLQKPLTLGLDPRDTALLVTTLGASILTFGTGKTNVLFGFLHLVLFGTFMFLVFVP